MGIKNAELNADFESAENIAKKLFMKKWQKNRVFALLSTDSSYRIYFCVYDSTNIDYLEKHFCLHFHCLLT